MTEVNPNNVPFIYNLFPPLVGKSSNWTEHIKRAAGMGFNWCFLNPIQYPGESGSLYSVRDHDRLNTLFFPQKNAEEQFKAFSEFVKESRDAGLEVMVDLVINHTAHDSPLIQKHPEWFKWLDDGTIAHPGAMDNGHWVIWGDLAEIDNENSSDKAGLYNYWWEMIKQMLDLGVRGFRCDAAYKVPCDLWRLLIGRAKEAVPEACFFAESLGCPFEDNLALTQAGFDYTFNSGKWWDYRGDWFLDQLREGCGRTRSICFPESHDTDRLMEEYRGDIERVKQHYAFTALITSGVMIVSGFEYGFKKRCHVVKSTPDDWEGQPADLRTFIGHTNQIKRNNRVFQEDNKVEKVTINTDNIMALKKTTLDGQESVIILLNLYGQKHGCSTQELKNSSGFGNINVIAGSVQVTENEVVLEPWGYAVLSQG
jgi:starch synthase (maltosyl-transferring)